MIKIAVLAKEEMQRKKWRFIILKIAKDHNIQVQLYINISFNILIKNKDEVKMDLLYVQGEKNHLEIDWMIANKDFLKEIFIIYSTPYFEEKNINNLLEIKEFHIVYIPFQKGIFQKVFSEKLIELDSKTNFISFTFYKTFYKIPIHEILFFESYKRLIYVHTSDKIYKFYGKLNEVEHEICRYCDGFLRVHQSYLINVSFIFKFNSKNIEFKTGTSIKISNFRKNILTEYFKDKDEIINLCD